MYVCMYVCMHVCMYVCMHASLKLVCIYVMYVCRYIRNICMYACICVTYVCMYVCMYMYYVCICVCVCVHRNGTNFVSTFCLTNTSTAATYFCRYKPAPRWDRRYIRSNGEQQNRHLEELGVHGQILSRERRCLWESKPNPSAPK